jgi:L-aspartate oxidase
MKPDTMPEPESTSVWREPDLWVPTLILGGGVAGFRAALEAAKRGPVLIVTKDHLHESNTAYAQGGVAAVFGEDDSIQSHVEDTLMTGQGLCDERAVKTVVGEGPERISELLEWGGQFDREGDRLQLGREGGHSHRRIIHAHGDATGKEFVRTLMANVVGNPNITLWEHVLALDLLILEGRCVGACVLKNARRVVITANATILCTGGAGQVYRETTNPEIATGDGVAMAYRAGARITDMEFFQFHPTSLYVAGAARHLITEAVRGEGAHLVDEKGDRFLFQFHADGELAPRDIVSRATVSHLARSGASCVYLDLRHLSAKVTDHFTGLSNICGLYNLDIAKDLIPVHPSAHYMMGGVETNLHAQASIPGLYAAGEVAASGLHGANRLASNSLLEGLVFGRLAGLNSAEEPSVQPSRVQMPGTARTLPATILNVSDMRNSIRSAMWKWAGIIRHGGDLKRAEGQLRSWQAYVQQVSFESGDGHAMENLLQVAILVVQGALWRCETRGAHFRGDHPERDDLRFRMHSVQQLGESIFGKSLV